ncbi:MAG: ferredoxin [Candidatus Micrarchaeota archaeon]
MAKYIIEFDHECCLGCGACAAVCPANWSLQADGKSKPTLSVVEELGCNEEAAKACPAGCIKVVKA